MSKLGIVTDDGQHVCVIAERGLKNIETRDGQFYVPLSTGFAFTFGERDLDNSAKHLSSFGVRETNGIYEKFCFYDVRPSYS